MTSNSETPQFGDLMRGKWASPDNPQRDGFFVRIIRRDLARMNPGVWYELTDKRGSFWQYRAEDCELIRREKP